MIPGLNSNIKHQGKIFHIQTEDSGLRYGHVISHLFLDGVILDSVKTDYKNLLDLDEAARLEEVQKIMRASHRQMLNSLTTGFYNRQAGLSEKAGEDLAETEDEPLSAAASKEVSPDSAAENDGLSPVEEKPEAPSPGDGLMPPEVIASLLKGSDAPLPAAPSMKTLVLNLLAGERQAASTSE